ncbi:zeta toxin [Acinetobacter stercoris]|uniref:Zeta toxin n=1 Tax=Acinetobacter stercoris TaxID=2126983 RepID=A0A2U3MVY0_9GAMM|nr:zeta toxin [Acinetobacter stercoris]SPL69581.1 Zeta toxin [Acinetobacter stercoris]
MLRPRIRMFAGPNGSGKSTIKEYLPAHQIGAYLNADELEKVLVLERRLDLSDYHPELSTYELITFLKKKKRKKNNQTVSLLSTEPHIENHHIIEFAMHEIDSYLAARIIDFIRLEFLRLKVSFTFETVMSHESKIEFLKKAQEQGFRVYLYYVATVDPIINIGRVKYRVESGGHDVPEQKIRDRYDRSMNLLMSAIDVSNRAYLFDNSKDGEKASFLAEIENAEILKINPSVERFPKWFVDRVLKEFS